MELMRCKKNFPKHVHADLKARVVKEFDGTMRYNPPRDDEFVNNYHPVLHHIWGANTDIQAMQSKGMICVD